MRLFLVIAMLCVAMLGFLGPPAMADPPNVTNEMISIATNANTTPDVPAVTMNSMNLAGYFDLNFYVNQIGANSDNGSACVCGPEVARPDMRTGTATIKKSDVSATTPMHGYGGMSGRDGVKERPVQLRR